VHHDLIRQLDEAVTEVFAVMLNRACASELVRSTPAESAIARTPRPAPRLTASVLFSGPLQGCCCLQIDQPTAAELTANLIGVPPDLIPPALSADTAGELCNMIAGCWKKRHSADLAAGYLSCPIVTLGKCHHAASAFRQAVTVLYRFGRHHLTVRLAFN
jgi:CheY-specific phosphatase CheX